MDNGFLIEIDQKIADAVDVREKGYTLESLADFNDIETELLETLVLVREGNPPEAYQGHMEALAAKLAVVYGHQIVCYKHVYDVQGTDNILDEMVRLCTTGLTLPISRHHLAVFHLRLGDVHTIRKDYVEAFQEHLLACQWAEPDSLAQTEYLGHMVDSQSNNGDHTGAISLGRNALERLEGHDIPEWHKLIIASGIYGRMAKAAKRNRSYFLAAKYFWACVRMSWELKTKHERPQRWNQLRARLI